MPELPEVETIVRGLRPLIVGAQITDVEIALPRMTLPSAEELRARVRGSRITAVHRRGKVIVFELSTPSILTVHLRMTGRLLFDAARTAATRVRISLDQAHHLDFADTRTLGRMTLLPAESRWQDELGVEPLSETFTPSLFGSLLAGRGRAIKPLLLEQRLIAGIGNIYACEALWEARIAPERRAATLTPEEIHRLHAAIQRTLQRAVDLRGTSARDYVDAEGMKGGFQNVLAVYGRADAPCQRCHAPIVRMVLAQRGTWFCPRCQPIERRRS